MKNYTINYRYRIGNIGTISQFYICTIRKRVAFMDP
jgi:hypothetical protein